MNSLNSILVEGNLTRDPLLAQTPKGTPVCNFSVASNRFYRNDEELQKEVSFFDVEVWSKLAERCGETLRKGRGVRVVGRLKQDRWTDGEGKNHSRIKIVGEHVEFRPVFSKPEAAETEQEPSVEQETDAELEEGRVPEPAEIPF
ncbi:MAG: single-stranded DNA-binding protein [Spirochaetaceae bacterium]|nr:MAG: single-stranded DNA-binding protein [Spirochaetaceae bacterium]